MGQKINWIHAVNIYGSRSENTLIPISIFFEGGHSISLKTHLTLGWILGFEYCPGRETPGGLVKTKGVVRLCLANLIRIVIFTN